MFEDDPLWYKDAIIYELHVKCFYDSNDDGIGDFAGLTQKLDYIKELGVTAIWLLPFYPSPLKDDGYDIANYRDVNPDYGTMRDFRAFVRKAHRLGLKVITELVINHTSDQHPWFQAARRAPAGSAKREMYVWSDTNRKFPETRIIFTDTESSNWAWDPVAGAYYWHRFFSHQPDLNHNNPRVVQAVERIMRFWLDVGVDGLRLDAIPYLCVREGTTNENLPETHEVIKQLRASLNGAYRNRMLLAEANQWPEDVRHYFGDGDECHMAYHFPLMPRIYMAVAQESREPIVEIMRQTPDIPETCQWGIFLRNHDELTLEMVTDRERDYMYQTYGSDPKMRRNVGICRRLASLMDNDRDRMELLNSLLFSMPGTPILYYGDELGMGDNIYLGDRDGVRTPMHWSIDRNAGFSCADPAQLYLPVIMNPIYGYQAVNVEAQSRSSSSLLSWMKRIIAVRKQHRAFGRGSIRFLEPHNQRILAYLREYDGETLLCVANLAGTPQPVELDLRAFNGLIPVELLGGTPFPRIGELPYLLTLPGFGFYWFRLSHDDETQTFEEQRARPLPSYPFWVLPDGWETVMRERERLVDEMLPTFLRNQRWFGGKGATIEQVELYGELVLDRQGHCWLLAVVDVQLAGWERQTYFLPLGLSWDDEADRLLQQSPLAVVAKVRHGPQPGVLHDAMVDPDFSRWLVATIGASEELPLAGARLLPSVNETFPETLDPESAHVERLGVEQSHTSVVLDDELVLKAYRRMPKSPSPELELGRYLTEVARFPNSPPVAGALELAREGQPVRTLVLLQGLVQNRGDGWSYTVEQLELVLEQQLSASRERPARQQPPTEVEGGREAYMSWARTLGLRTGQLHLALAQPSDNERFTPEPITAADLEHWCSTVRSDAEHTLEAVRGAHRGLPQTVQQQVDRLLELEPALQQRLERVPRVDLEAVKIRFHGDYHLGQVLVVGHDVQIIDFEGEQPRPGLAQVLKHSALRDVAGMLRSFEYAASTALDTVAVGRPDDRDRLLPVIAAWRERAVRAFLDGYDEPTAGSSVVPKDPEHRDALLQLFTLEKALYEVNYELNHRPDWLWIPIQGLLDLLGDGSGS